MKLNRNILFLPVAIIIAGAVAARADHAVRVIGFVNLTNYQAALLAITDSPPDAMYLMGSHQWVAEGQRFDGQSPGEKRMHVEVRQIDFTNVTVHVLENGVNTHYLPANTNLPAVAAGNNLLLQQADYDDALDLYARLKNRTVLVHPQVKQSPVTLAAEAHNRTEAAGILGKALQENNATILADGNQFEWVVPAGVATPALPARKPPSTNSVNPLPANSINFINVDLHQVMDVYQALTDRKWIQSKPLPIGIMLAFHNQTPLTKYETLHALDVVLAWRGLKIVNVDDKSFELVPIAAGN